MELTLNLERLRTTPALSQRLDAKFDGARLDLVIDASLVADSTFAEFTRLRQTRALDVAEFVALKISPHADTIFSPEYRNGATWYRLAKSELADAMRAALNFPEEHSMILTCPRCKADRGFTRPPVTRDAPHDFPEPSRPQLRRLI